MKKLSTTILSGLLLVAAAAQAAISIETVTVRDIGNVNDPTTGYGSVGYAYRIGKYEVTIGQYTAFLNAVAKTDTYSLYDTSMGTDMNVAGISRSGSTGSYTYSVIGSADRPITYVNWFDAARFSNWMANGQPVGAQAANTTENGAYTLNGAMSGTNFVKNLVNPITQGEVSWWIPSENEWYKAAYYDLSKVGGAGYWLYPTQSDSAPGNVVGSAGGANYRYYNGSNSIYSVTQSSSYSSTQNYLTSGGAYNAASYYGTFDQGGNAWEWNDAVISSWYRGRRGGSWIDLYDLQSSLPSYSYPDYESYDVGFRVASVPEPFTIGLMLLSGSGWLVWKRRRVAI